jgi:hypothetical protein
MTEATELLLLDTSIVLHLIRNSPLGRSLDERFAVAVATGALLLTTDRDFDPLHPTHIRRELVEQTQET